MLTSALAPALTPALALVLAFGVASVLLSPVLPSPTLHAQGFDWQYSSREPTSFPRMFLGVVGSFGASTHYGSIPNLQKQGGDTCFVCGTFQNGTGTGFSVGVQGEYWLADGDWAIVSSLRFERADSRFSYETDNGPWRPTPTTPPRALITATSLTNNTRHLRLDLGAKVKFFPSPIIAALSLQGAYLLGSQSLQFERKVSPAEHPFERTPDQISALEFRRANLGAMFALGADVPLARGLYAVPSVFVSVPLLSASVSPTGASGAASALPASNWRWWHYGIQIAVLYGWLPEREMPLVEP
jgi:hypothetical protein